MLTRKWIIKKDYPFISNWCKQRDWDSSIPKEILPAVGVIVIDQDPICAAGLFVDKTSKLGFILGVFSKPKDEKTKIVMKDIEKGYKMFIDVGDTDDQNSTKHILQHMYL